MDSDSRLERPTPMRRTRPGRAVRLRGLATAFVMLAALPARAETPPFASPQCDADITYRMQVPGAPAQAAPLSQRLRVQAGTGLQRIDPPSAGTEAGTYMITDGRSGRMIVVQPGNRSAVQVPSPGGRLPPPGERASGDYQRLGQERIAGNACTDWRTRDRLGQESVVCLTEDGMLLQVAQQGRVLAQAVRLDRSAQPASVFAVPPGYRMVPAP